MKAVRRRDTKPEVEVRRLLWNAGARFRLCPRNLPGSPDIANKSARWAVFVHGCFWHGHRNCKLATVPKSNSAFWEAKLAANRQRDARMARALRQFGFRVLVVWQCELRDEGALARRFSKAGITKR
ncbi:very short patch repair endonuclease [Myxococcus sp. NMCA1]|uniref:very short patch repair endonuclease n=1 Tax=Myxococcus sp. NMCA1 TaxID=2996785 RepID=UPI002285935B|nr:very short patch repair endonuclease [Myxococcus sp. NMCA1]WAM30239.1 very short patch repair endonuclease [Myxococcus sp. NMCA1]